MSQPSVTLHEVVDPVAGVATSTDPNVCASALNIIFPKLSFVAGAVSPLESSKTFLLAEKIGSDVACAIRPGFHALAMHRVFKPVSDALSTICVRISAEAVRAVFQPITNIEIAFGVDEATTAVGHAASPVSLIQAAVGPDAIAFAVR